MIGGHGHVRPRPDGLKARCGGPAICKACALEAAQLAAKPTIRPTLNTDDDIARELYAIMQEAAAPRVSMPAALEYDRLPADVRAGWRAVAAHVRHAYP